MPSWISNGGKWVPAKEKIALTNLSDKAIKYKGKDIEPGEPFIYEGADREALAELHRIGEEHLGHSFKDDNEFLEFLHNSYKEDTFFR